MTNRVFQKGKGGWEKLDLRREKGLEEIGHGEQNLKNGPRETERRNGETALGNWRL